MFVATAWPAPTSPVSRAALGPPRRMLKIDFEALSALADALAQHCAEGLKEEMREDAADLRNAAHLDQRMLHDVIYRLCSRIIRFRALRHTIIVAAEEKAGCPGMVNDIVRYFAALPPTG